jgi:tetratricopeptide (TPR) repeat protein
MCGRGSLLAPDLQVTRRMILCLLDSRCLLRSLRAAIVPMAVALSLTACSGSPDEEKAARLERGNQYFQEGKYAEAVIEYRGATQIDARFGAAHAKLAEAYSRLGDRTNALRSYVRAADTLPDDVELQITAGNYLLLARLPDDAQVRAQSVLKRDPANVRAHILLGNALAGLNDLEKGVAEIEEAIRLDPKRGATYSNLGALEAARGRQVEAEAAFKKAIEFAPELFASHLSIANFYWTTGKLTDAEAAFQAARKLAPDDTLVNRGLAAFYLVTGRAAEAETYLKVIADTSGDPSSLLALVDYYLATNRPNEAIARLEPLTADPRIGRPATRRLAQVYAATGEQSRATELTERLLTQDPADADALMLKGEMLFAAGKKDEALEMLTAAAKAAPASVAIRFALGKLFAARGDLDAAERAFGEVLRLNPRAAAAEVELSKLHLVRGSAVSSLKFAQDAVTKVPGNVEARVALVRSFMAQGDVTRAEAELAPLLAAYGNLPAVLVQRGVLATFKKDLVLARTSFQRALDTEPNAIDALAGLVTLDLAAADVTAARARVQENPNFSCSPPEPQLRRATLPQPKVIFVRPSRWIRRRFRPTRCWDAFTSASACSTKQRLNSRDWLNGRRSPSQR